MLASPDLAIPKNGAATANEGCKTRKMTDSPAQRSTSPFVGKDSRRRQPHPHRAQPRSVRQSLATSRPHQVTVLEPSAVLARAPAKVPTRVPYDLTASIVSEVSVWVDVRSWYHPVASEVQCLCE